MSNAQLTEIDQPATSTRALAVADNSPVAMMMAAMDRGASLEQVEKMMDLQDRWEAREAEKSYNKAFAEFKAEAVIIIKAKSVTDGPLRGKSYAELHDVVHAVTPALSRHGLSASWKLTKDEPQWMEVTCTLKHIDGHSDSVSMGGPPDAGGAKNALQARASTKSYLERYTLKAVCGVAEGGDDSDGALYEKGAQQQSPRLDPSADIAELQKTKTDDDALAYWKDNNGKYKTDVAAHAEFKTATLDHRMNLKAQNITDVEVKE